MRPIEQFRHAGLTIKLIPDDSGDQEFPFNDDSGVIFAEFSRRTIRHHEFKQPDEVLPWCAANDYEAFPMRRYEHGSVGYTLADSRDSAEYPFNCQWDSWQAGWVLVAHDEGDSAQRRAIAEGACSAVTTWANGWYYGYVVEDEHGKPRESCWGFDDLDYCRKEATSAAESAAKEVEREEAQQLWG